ncbi:MAG: hypothetical protein ACIAQF_06130 [Phycisphaerales bacterium JB065]
MFFRIVMMSCLSLGLGLVGLRACDASVAHAVRPQMVQVAQYVTVHLRDGREFTGRLLDETQHKITLEVEISGIVVEMTFGANEVQSVERLEAEDGDPSQPERPNRKQDDGREAQSGEGGWVLVPAHGTIGVELTKNFFESCLEKSINAGAEAVIFDLESPGGYLYSLGEIYDSLHEHSEDIQIVFYVDGECFSAAALLCITSEKFFVGPNASFGSAVVIRDNGNGGVDAVNAKYAAAAAAIWRTRTELRKRPGLLVNAMMLMETELWADKSTTPWKLYPSKPDGGLVSVEQVDNNRTILSMTASEAVALGAADDFRDDIDQLIESLGLENPDREATSGAAYARTVIRNQQRRIADLDARIKFIESVYKRIADGIEDESITIESFRRDLIRVRASLDRIKREIQQTDYIQFYCLVNDLTAETIEEYKKEIDDALRQIR